LVSFSSPNVHDARSQEPKISLYIYIRNQMFLMHR